MALQILNSDYLDEDLRLLTEIKRLNPGFQLSDSVRKRLRDNYLKASNNLAKSKVYSVFKDQETEKSIQSQNDEASQDGIKTLIVNSDAIKELKEEINKLKEEKRGVSTVGYVAGLLKWDVGISFGMSFF